jgi:nucleoside-diphosphate-sugar epimerase
MRISIVGHAGFIGEFLVKKLAALGHSLRGLDIQEPSEDQKNLCTCFIGSILSPEDVRNAIKDTDMVIALAAKHHDFGVTREEFFNVNETGTQILLDAMTRQEINKLVFYSTVAVYGSQDEPTTEETQPEPDSDYGESKLAAEKLVAKWSNGDSKRSSVVIRPTVVFGPHNYANVYNLIDKIYRKRFFFVGKGDNIKSVAYVENLADATIFAIQHIQPGIEILNYSDEPQMTTSQIVDIISDIMQRGLPKLRIPLRLATSIGSAFDLLAKLTGRNLPITAARMRKFATATHHKSGKIREMGFKQKVTIREGFDRMVEWYLRTQI